LPSPAVKVWGRRLKRWSTFETARRSSLINAVLIWGSLGGSHSSRHVLGGRLNHFKAPGSVPAVDFRRTPNATRQEWAWASMIWIALADIYLRLVAAGVFPDPHWIA
jgi:hypothetical protein